MHTHPSHPPAAPSPAARRLLLEHDRQVRGSIARRLPDGWSAFPADRVLRVRTPHRGFAFTDGLHGLSEDEVDDAVASTVAFFAGHGEGFEWKAYSHDHPALVPALRRHGLVADPTETVLVGPTGTFTDAGAPPDGVGLRRVRLRADLEAIAALQSEVWDEDWSWLAEDLEDRLRSAPDDVAIWVAEVEGRAVSTAWLVRLPGTGFAGLWGGSTLAAWRRRGVYRSLVAVRARHAQRLGVRHLWVDASDDSRPILERLGMTAVATTTPWIASPGGHP
ncbi:GNAT family N-acetyltransferase [Amnibacterium endophyticum]|uniref:GNAT family N-acetyltransferase n=1 Tax=Amnibacterium endophyticum TaxID=2109337 RepID=A0ABW4LBC2_9MICO